MFLTKTNPNFTISIHFSPKLTNSVLIAKLKTIKNRAHKIVQQKILCAKTQIIVFVIRKSQHLVRVCSDILCSLSCLQQQ